MAADIHAPYNAGGKRAASQMLRVMQAISAEAQKAGAADMSLDEINAARNGL